MELIFPTEKYYLSYVDAINEYEKNNVRTYDFLDGSRGPQNAVFKRIEDHRLGRNLPENYVKATFLWLVRHDEFIGEVSIRHSLTDALMRFGGNIGYGVRYSEWNKGFGTIMLSEALIYAKEGIGLKRVLITCNDTNVASARVIEKNGGILQDKIVNVFDNVESITGRYWIDIL